MVWKVFFVITTILHLWLFMLGLFEEMPSLSYYECFVSILSPIGLTFLIGLFYSLGWKQKLFSTKVKNILTIVFVFCIIDFLVGSSLEAYQIFLEEQQSNEIAIIGGVINFVILAFIANVLLIPFYIGMHKYKKEDDNLTSVQKPYWKLLCFFIIPSLVGTIIFFATKFSHFASYNFLDYFVATSCIYEIIFMIGFAWDKNIFNKLFWKITFVPYIACLFMVPFFNSELFFQDFNCQFDLDHPVIFAYGIIINILLVYMLYKYTFTKKEIYE